MTRPLDELVQDPGNVLAELGAVVSEVLDEEVGKERGGGAQPSVADAVVGELRDEEDERSGSATSARRRRIRHRGRGSARRSP